MRPTDFSIDAGSRPFSSQISSNCWKSSRFRNRTVDLARLESVCSRSLVVGDQSLITVTAFGLTATVLHDPFW